MTRENVFNTSMKTNLVSIEWNMITHDSSIGLASHPSWVIVWGEKSIWSIGYWKNDGHWIQMETPNKTCPGLQWRILPKIWRCKLAMVRIISHPIFHKRNLNFYLSWILDFHKFNLSHLSFNQLLAVGEPTNSIDLVFIIIPFNFPLHSQESFLY